MGAAVQWVHVLALMGDASDNVPGVPGVGSKGALSLIQEYGTVESVLENADKARHAVESISWLVHLMPGVALSCVAHSVSLRILWPGGFPWRPSLAASLAACVPTGCAHIAT